MPNKTTSVRRATTENGTFMALPEEMESAEVRGPTMCKSGDIPLFATDLRAEGYRRRKFSTIGPWPAFHGIPNGTAFALPADRVVDRSTEPSVSGLRPTPRTPTLGHS